MRHGFIALWIATLVGSTVGVSIHTLYCHCLQSSRLSIINIDPCVYLKGSCEKTESTVEKSTDCCQTQEKKCDSKVSYFAQLKADFTVEKTVKLPSFQLDFLTLPPVPLAFVGQISNYFYACRFNKPPPLPITGQSIRILFQSYRC